MMNMSNPKNLDLIASQAQDNVDLANMSDQKNLRLGNQPSLGKRGSREHAKPNELGLDGQPSPR